MECQLEHYDVENAAGKQYDDLAVSLIDQGFLICFLSFGDVAYFRHESRCSFVNEND